MQQPNYQVIPIHITHHEEAIYIPLGSVTNMSSPYIKVNLRLSLPSHIYVQSTDDGCIEQDRYIIEPVTPSHILHFRYILTSTIHTHLHTLLVSFVTVNLPLSAYIQTALQLTTPAIINTLTSPPGRSGKEKKTTLSSTLTEADEKSAYFISNVITMLPTDRIAFLIRDAITEGLSVQSSTVVVNNNATGDSKRPPQTRQKENNVNILELSSPSSSSVRLLRPQSTMVVGLNHTVPQGTGLPQKQRNKIIADNAAYTNGLLSCYCSLGVFSGRDYQHSINTSLRNIHQWRKSTTNALSEASTYHSASQVGKAQQQRETRSSQTELSDPSVPAVDVKIEEDLPLMDQNRLNSSQCGMNTSPMKDSNSGNHPSGGAGDGSPGFVSKTTSVELYSSEIIDLCDDDYDESENHDESDDDVVFSGRQGHPVDTSREHNPEQNLRHSAPRIVPEQTAPLQQVFPLLAHPDQADVLFEYNVATSSTVHPGQQTTSSMAGDVYDCVFIYPQLNNPISQHDYHMMTGGSSSPLSSQTPLSQDDSPVEEVGAVDNTAQSMVKHPLPDLDMLSRPNGTASSTSVPLQINVYTPLPITQMTVPPVYARRLQQAIHTTNEKSRRHPITATTKMVSMLDNPTFHESTRQNRSTLTGGSAVSTVIPTASPRTPLNGHNTEHPYDTIIPQLVLYKADPIPICVYFSQLWAIARNAFQSTSVPGSGSLLQS